MTRLSLHGHLFTFGLDLTVEAGPVCTLTYKWQIRVPNGGGAN